MMYKIIDVIEGVAVAIMDSKAKVQSWLSRLGRMNDLNVTGKDMRSPYKGIDSKVYFYNQDNFRLRRYQVVDEEGRSVDPRDWEPVDANEVREPLYWLETCNPRHTRYRAHGKANALIRQAEREADASLELDVRPVRVNTKIRTKFKNAGLFRSEEWKCWKNKKTARQWGRHKKGFTRPTKLTDALMSVEEVDAMDWATMGIMDEILRQGIEDLELVIQNRITELDGIPDEVISEAECREVELLRLLNPWEDIQCHGDCQSMSVYFMYNEDIYRTYLADEIEMLEYCAKPVMF